MTARPDTADRGQALAEDLEQYRRELTGYCYRMLGSVFDADDALQDTLLRAWRGLSGFQGRSALRSWLYTIATNSCLTQISRRPKRVLPIDYGPCADPHTPPGEPIVESVWMEPYPDEMFGVQDELASPEARYEQREGIELAFVAALQHLAPNQRAVLILREVMGFSAKETADMLELSRLNVLWQTTSDRYLKDKKPTDAELRAEYDTQVKQLPHTEYHVRHILVATQPFAQKLIEQLDKGAKFNELAQRESMDSSKDNGGDLGWITPENMAQPFAQAVTGLKAGEYTHSPVQTQYGWHVIRVEETRELQAPQFDSPQVQQQLVRIVENKKFRAYTDELMKNAKIDRTDEKKKT